MLVPEYGVPNTVIPQQGTLKFRTPPPHLNSQALRTSLQDSCMSARHGIVLGTIFKHHHPHDHYSLDYVGNMGGYQNSGPFLGTLNIRCLIIIGIQKRTTILTTTHILPYQSPDVDPDGDLASACPAPLLSLTPVCWQAVEAFEFAAGCAATTVTMLDTEPFARMLMKSLVRGWQTSISEMSTETLGAVHSKKAMVSVRSICSGGRNCAYQHEELIPDWQTPSFSGR